MSLSPRRLLIIILLCVLVGTAHARTIKVLILDDTFQELPQKDEKMVSMGKLHGELLVNGTQYQGDIEVWKSRRGMYVINELPLEEYVKSVVDAEVGPNWDMEALKAQAVVVRTYALYQLDNKTSSNYDITSSVMHQVYKGATVDPRAAYAVAHTEGEVLTYGGRLIEAFFHSTSAGMTEDPAEVFGQSFPYLKPVKTHCELSPYYVWERRIPKSEIEKGLDLTGIIALKISTYTSTGRVKTVDITHNKGVITVKATDLRKILGWRRLPSTNFVVTRDSNDFVFDGKGYGHGVGLCQWSALQMARDGKNYREILSYFYPGTKIQHYGNN